MKYAARVRVNYKPSPVIGGPVKMRREGEFVTPESLNPQITTFAVLRSLKQYQYK
jgi:hypothetical protein